MILTLRTAHSGDVSQIAALLIANSVALGGTLYGDYSDASVAAWIRRCSPPRLLHCMKNIRSIRAHKRLGMSVIAGVTLDNENFLVMTV